MTLAVHPQGLARVPDDELFAGTNAQLCAEVIRLRKLVRRLRRNTLPKFIVDAARRYNATDWSDGRDPSKLGALNAVAFIGERVAALVAGPDSRRK